MDVVAEQECDICDIFVCVCTFAEIHPGLWPNINEILLQSQYLCDRSSLQLTEPLMHGNMPGSDRALRMVAFTVMIQKRMKRICICMKGICKYMLL